MNLADITARVKRLERLSMGLMKELVIIGKGEDPLLHLERRAYMKGLRDGLSGVEGARVVLVKAVQRLNPA